MFRRFVALCAAQTCASVFLAVMIAGCGGDADVRVVSGGGNPTPLPGTAVSGQVRMPKGQVASAPTSLFTRLAQVVVARAEALSGSVLPVGSGVLVQLFQIEPSDIVNGVIQGGKFLGDGDTNGSGFYQVEVPVDVSEETCRLIVQVGTGSSLTRAFVSSFSAPMDISFESETVVRLILAKVANGVPFCNYSNQDIEDLLAAVHNAPGTAVGNNASSINQSAFQLASVDPTVQQVLNSAGLTPTNTPTRATPPTRTPTPTNTQTPLPATGTPSVTVTRTPSASPTLTGTASATPSNTSTVTSTVTRTTSPTSTSTPTSTDTVVPTPTFTNTVIPTATATNTEIPTATLTNTATNTPIPTPTNTSVPTATFTSSVPAGNIDVGSGSGSPGNTVSIPVTLSNSGGKIAATSNDIVYDSAQVNVALKVNGKPDCTINPDIGTDTAASKTLVASVPNSPANAKILRVGIFGSDNANIIPDGPLFTCNFVIAANATAGVKVLTNTPGASDADANSLAVSGTNGQITVNSAPTPTATSTATAIPTATATTVPSAPQARLAQGIGAGDTTITVDDISGLPDSGTLLIGQELITYSGKQATGGGGGAASGVPGMLLNVQRGVGGTTASAHGEDELLVLVPSGATINVGSANGVPGATVVIGVVLANSNAQIAATSNDIVFDSSQLSVKLKANQKPDCTINAAISTDTAASKTLVASLPSSPANAKILRVGIFGSDNANIIPDGLLFTCNFIIDPAATLGLKPLNNTPGASDASAGSLSVDGTDGSITVESAAAPTASPTVAVAATSTATTAVAQPTATNTVPPAATNTVPPAATNTVPPAATNTVPPTATNTVPPTATQPQATATTPAAAPTNTVPAATPTTPAGSPAVNVGSGSGTPGATVVIDVTLANSGGIIAATSNDIVYDSSLVNVKLKANNKPDCTINNDINVDSAASKTLVASQPSSPANAKILRVGIFGSDNANIIPDGLLFTCNFVIANGATGTIILTNVPGASNASAQSVTVGGTNGSITVQGGASPTATPTTPSGPAVNVGSASGAAGSMVVITVSLANSGGIIAATSNDIVYDSSLVNVKLKANNKPDCTIDAAINVDSAASKTLVASQPSSPANAKILRVGIFGSDNANIIPDGTLFTCNFTIAAGATGTIALTNVPGASNAAAQSVTVGGTNGSITVL